MDAVDVLGRIDRVGHRPRAGCRRQRHLDDDPADQRIVVELDDRRRRRAAEARPGQLDQAALDADAPARPQDLLEVDRRRRVRADDHDGQRRRITVTPAERRRRRPSPGPDLGRDRGTEQETRFACRATRLRRLATGGPSRTRGDDLSGLGGEDRRSRPGARRPAPTAWPPSASSPTDGRLISDVRGGTAGGRLAEQRGHGEVARGVQVAPSGQRLGRCDESRAGLDDMRAARSMQSRAAVWRAVRSGRLLGVGLLGQLQRRRITAVRRGIFVGEPEEPIRQFVARRRAAARRLA